MGWIAFPCFLIWSTWFVEEDKHLWWCCQYYPATFDVKPSKKAATDQYHFIIQNDMNNKKLNSWIKQFLFYFCKMLFTNYGLASLMQLYWVEIFDNIRWMTQKIRLKTDMKGNSWLAGFGFTKCQYCWHISASKAILCFNFGTYISYNINYVRVN